MHNADFQKELERLRLQGKGKMMVVTDHFLVYADAHGPQRVPLVAVSKVVTDGAGELTIDAQPHGSIQGDIRGFDVPELRTFFERLKHEITRAKQEASVNVEAIPTAETPIEPVHRVSRPSASRVLMVLYVILGAFGVALIGFWLFISMR